MSTQKEAPTGSPTPVAAEPASEDKLPPLPLVAAGLSALNGMLAAGCFGLFLWDYQASAPLIQRAAPFLVFAGVAGVAAGAIILVKNKRGGQEMSGTVWANPAVLIGLLLMTASVFLPLLSALSMLVDGSANH